MKEYGIGGATINNLKDEIQEVLETGLADVTVIHEVQAMIREFRNTVDDGKGNPEEVIVPADIADAVRVRLYAAVDVTAEEVTED